MEIKIIPSKLLMAFDSLNVLAEQEHENGYVQAFSSVLNSLAHFIERDASVEIPESIVNTLGKDKVSGNKSNVLFGDILAVVSRLGRELYLLDEYEVIFTFHINNMKYQLKCNSDPIVFIFESK